MNRSTRLMVRGLAALVGLVLVGCGSSLDANATNGGGGGGTAANSGTVTGKVTGSFSLPVAGATVTIVGVAPATTNASGDYTLVGVPAGFQSLVVAKNGYAFNSVMVNVIASQTVTYNVVGTATAQPPRLTAAVTPGTLTFVGGTVQVNASATSPVGNTVTIFASYDGGTIPLTRQLDGSYRGTVALAANPTTTTKTYVFTISASDQINQVSSQANVDVAGLLSPGGVGGSVGGSGSGQPPVPSIR